MRKIFCDLCGCEVTQSGDAAMGLKTFDISKYHNDYCARCRTLVDGIDKQCEVEYTKNRLARIEALRQDIAAGKVK